MLYFVPIRKGMITFVGTSEICKCYSHHDQLCQLRFRNGMSLLSPLTETLLGNCVPSKLLF